MEAITIKLDLNKISALNKMLRNVKIEPIDTRDKMVQRSIVYELGKRLMKKEIDLFGTSKKVSFKMKYYEAAALEDLIRLLLEHHAVPDPFPVRMVADEINQKLA